MRESREKICERRGNIAGSFGGGRVTPWSEQHLASGLQPMDNSGASSEGGGGGNCGGKLFLFISFSVRAS